MGWWSRRPATVQGGSVLFRGRWVARPEDFAFLKERGVRVGPAVKLADGGWRAPLHHDAWGEGALLVDPDPPLPPAVLVRFEQRLTDGERAEILSCRYAVAVSSTPRTGNVLSDRKDLLRWLHAVMGVEGIAAVDHAAQAFWSRPALEVELSQDADLDIEAVYTCHLVGAEDELNDGAASAPPWLHSHGLRELGFWDFDVLDPSPDLTFRAQDLVRALAFAVVEETLAPGSAPFPIADRELVRAVAVEEFLSRAPAGEHGRYRKLVDEWHTQGHAVLCDPGQRRGLWGRLLGEGVPRPSRFLSQPFPDDGLIHFSQSASELMARRARGSLALFRAAMEEVAELEPTPLVKIGYAEDGGGPADLEHLWFRVHGFQGDAVDATLLNAPFRIARMKEGDRGLHPLAQLTDWLLLTPVGQLDPRQTRVLRFIRENWERLRELAAEARRRS